MSLKRLSSDVEASSSQELPKRSVRARAVACEGAAPEHRNAQPAAAATSQPAPPSSPSSVYVASLNGWGQVSFAASLSLAALVQANASLSQVMEAARHAAAGGGEADEDTLDTATSSCNSEDSDAGCGGGGSGSGRRDQGARSGGGDKSSCAEEESLNTGTLQALRAADAFSFGALAPCLALDVLGWPDAALVASRVRAAAQHAQR